MNSEGEAFTVKILDPEKIRLTRKDGSSIELSVEDNCSYERVKVVKAAPLSSPEKYISFLNKDNEEIGMIIDPSGLDPDSRAVVEEEIGRRYFTPEIRKIKSLKFEMGASYWDVETTRGSREFVVKNTKEDVINLSETHILIVDADGNRFEISNWTRLDGKSIALLEIVL